MNIITGYRGEAHITSAQDRGKNQGAFGVNSYILNVGDKLAADIVSANEIRIRDGVLSMQGCVASIDEGAYDSCEISNGTQGMQRCDLIVARYTRNIETNIEDISLVVIEGTPASSSPSDPSYNTGDIQAGDSPVDFPLYRVNINGVNISGTTKLASSVRTQAETDTLLGDTSISGIGNGTVTGALSTLNSKMDVTTFSIGGESVLSGGNLRGTYDKSINAVRIYLSFAATSNLSTTSVLFKVNQIYAPSSTTYGCLFSFNSSNAIAAGAYLQIDTSGNVRQVAGNTIRSGFGCFEYAL